ncbi:hypothetical protein BVX94_01575 [bacterium B17]|nr:hypothetical protein BVX94_01575 [bacterium B17]
MWMKSNLNRIERMRAGQYMPLKLTEKRFNGYFSRGRAGEMGLASMSGAMGEDYFSIKAVKQFASFRIKGYGFDIGLSLLVKYGVAEGTASLKSGAIGHIPLPGPLAKLSEVIMVSLIKDSKEHNAAKLMKNAELLSGQLTLRLEK